LATVIKKREEELPECCLWGGSEGLLVLVEEDLVALHYHAHTVPGPVNKNTMRKM
jgi:hypothetical protein